MPLRLILSFSVASFIAAGGALFLLARVDARLEALEARTPCAPAGAPLAGAFPGSPASRAAPPATPAGNGGEAPPGDLKSLVEWLVERGTKADENQYDYYMETSKSLYELGQAVRQMQHALTRIKEGMAAQGWIAPPLPPREVPFTAEQRTAALAEAERFGIAVEPGRVTCRGFLNEPDPKMPIEYFATLFPEAGHETLVHFLGAASLEAVRERGRAAVQGLPTALYKALRVAGFVEGEPGHPGPEVDGKPREWELPTGDTVYLYVRYEEAGVERLSRATDWMIDPATGAVFPPDSFKFTGSFRLPHPETGEETLGAELVGLLISVQPMRSALLEVALATAVRNNYRYNFERIPRAAGGGILHVDLVFSKEPLEVR